MVFAEIITIGDEILYGQITDTNTQWISAELDKVGIKTIRKSSVGDKKEEILSILTEAESRASIILITGGLGPTKDDITKNTLCEYFGTSLALNAEAEAMVTEFFQKRGRTLTEINRGQALLPIGSTYLPNQWGTAPGMWFERNGKVFVSMPGVPSEMKGLMAVEVIPRLQKQFDTPIIFHRVIKTVGIGESYLSEMIAPWEDALPPHIRLAYLPSLAQVKLRLTGVGQDLTTIQQEVMAQEALLRPQIDEYVFGYDKDELETVIGSKLIAQNATLATAESCTGGNIAAMLTKISGSSAYFWGSVVAYSNAIKMAFLGVKPETLEAHGAVSEQTIREMAEGCRQRMGTTYAIASSGIAGPTGGTPDKPVGTVWVAVATPTQTITKLLQLGGSREQNITTASIYALNLLRKVL